MKLSRSFKYRKIADKQLLIAVKNNPVTNSMIELNDTTAKIIEFTIENCSKEEIIKRILKEYKLDSNYRHILADTLTYFLKAGILEE